MAIVVESVGTLTETASDGSIAIPKPSGLAAGDLMIMIIGAYQSGGSRTTDTPAGWTFIQHISGDEEICASYWKIASAGDAAASDFTVQISGIADVMCGTILRLTGFASGYEIASGETDTGDTSVTTVSYTTAIAATSTESLVIAHFQGANTTGANVSVGSYTSTPSLTWTERADIGGANGSLCLGFAVATAPNTGLSNVTARGATFGGTSNDGNDSICIIVNASVGVTVSPTVVTMSSSVQSPSVSGGANVSPTVVTMTSSVPSPVVTVALPEWNNTDKSATTWDNQEKS